MKNDENPIKDDPEFRKWLGLKPTPPKPVVDHIDNLSQALRKFERDFYVAVISNFVVTLGVGGALMAFNVPWPLPTIIGILAGWIVALRIMR